MKTFTSLPAMARLTAIILLTSSFLLHPSSLLSQGFNYQAVVRGSDNLPLASENVGFRFSILNAAQAAVYTETQNTSTNALGMVSLVIGEADPASFASIDWSAGGFSLKVEMDPAGGNNYTLHETKPMQLVPYSLYAGKAGAVGAGKIEVTGDDSQNDEEALFEVKRNDGQTVFAVYPDGVRVYVEDPPGKGSKGGFAVGGFDPTKGLTSEFLRVTPDSVRIYVAGEKDKGPKGGFAVGGFDPHKGAKSEILRVTPDSVRIYVAGDSDKGPKGGFAVGGFDPAKGAGDEYFRVTPDSVRIYIEEGGSKGPKGGFAVGGFNPAKGLTDDYLNVSGKSAADVYAGVPRVLWYPLKEAFLAGNVLVQHPDSVGTNSWASGYQSKAIGDWSQALGYQAIARGDYSTAIGKNAVANKVNSFAFGEDAIAKNEESYAFGRGAVAEGFRSYAFGSAGVDEYGNVTDVARAIGNYSFAIGQGSVAAANGSFAFGICDSAKGRFSMAIGFYTSARGDYSSAYGIHTVAEGYGSVAMCYNNIASANYSLATGYSTKASGIASFSSGSNTQATASNATAMGMGSKAFGYASTALGYSSEAGSSYSTAIGMQTRATANYAMALGSGTVAEGSSSMALGNSSRASGNSSIAIGGGTIANGPSSISMGYQTSSRSLYEMVVGCFNEDYTPLAPTGFNDFDRIFVVGTGSNNVYRKNAMTILKSGRIGLQTITSPTYALELPNSSTVGIGQARAYAWTTYSDGRAKTERQPISYGLIEVMQLNPQSYYHHSTESKEGIVDIKPDGAMDIGLIAQEVYEVIPEAVNKPENEQSDLWSLSYDKLVPVLVRAIQEQQQIIENQQSQINDLKSLVNELANK